MATNRRVVGNNFDPYLVGLQFTSEGGTPLFTIGNFQITTNLTAPVRRNFQLGAFSDPISLDNLGTTLSEADQFVTDNLSIFLNLNTENLLSFTLFGSFKKFIEVTLNQILLNWPGSIYVFGVFGLVTGDTVQNYVYDSVTNQATFDVNTNFFYNNFGVNYLQSATILTGTSLPNTIRNLTVYYPEYVIYVNGQSYPIVGFVGSATITNGTCTFTVEGDPFPGVTNTSQPYHIRPNDVYLERFFSSLDDFSRFLLNRNTVPQYTAKIYYELENEQYQILEKIKKLTWPVSDGYNLDKNTGEFLIYKQSLLGIAENYDDYKTDLMRRVLVTESVSYFELSPRINSYYPINTTDKIDKLLTIYGREFDEVKKYIDGISFANVVSYNKVGNTPDALIKDFAYYLGWDLLSPMDENQLLSNFMPLQSFYSGMTVGYTPAEAEIEFWRRLVLNSAFLFKSKGTRKAIEFLFDFINAPPALINFNEYIYQAKNKLDVNLFKEILRYLYNNDNIETFNIDEEGYPKVPVDTLSNYFQKGGGWYRETAGINSQIDYYEGNNPHIGPYDGGQYYIDKFRCLLDNFSGQTIRITEEYVEFTNLFTNYYKGKVDGYDGDIFANAVDENNNPTDCIVISGSVVSNPQREEYNECGCLIPSAITNAILITVKKSSYTNISCSSDTQNNTATVLGDLKPCSTCTGQTLNVLQNSVVYDCGGGPTELVPIDCCQSLGNKVDFTWIEYYNTETGFCFYDDPCKDLLYLGNATWASVSGSTFTITSQVPKNCCLYRGGLYNEFTGLCEPA